MEEDCDGYCMHHLIDNEDIKPDLVVLGEPTDLDVYRGHRGRLEATITTHGVSAHGAHASRGVNALYKMAPIISDVENLNETLAEDDFLGKGSVIVSFIECTSPSLNAVPDCARIYLDRRMTVGETHGERHGRTEGPSPPRRRRCRAPEIRRRQLARHPRTAGQVLPDLGPRGRPPPRPGSGGGRNRSPRQPARDLALALLHQRCRHHGPLRASRPSASPPASKSSPTPPKNE